jgi:hypothetical protein
MKTIKQIADELKIPKQKVYRYIKRNHISEAHQDNGVMYYDDVAETRIKQGFLKNEAHHEAHHDAVNDAVNEAVIEALMKQLEVKDKQIQDLSERLAEVNRNLDQAQKLHALDKQKILEIESKPEPEPESQKSWWKRFF